MYALHVEFEDYLKKAKGVRNNIVSRTITFKRLFRLFGKFLYAK